MTPRRPLSLSALVSCVPRVWVYETLSEVIPIPYRFWGNWEMTLGVLLGIRHICLDNLMRHRSSAFIWGMEKGATWKE